MAYTTDYIAKSPEEEKFYDYLKTGDDFMKIEIYYLAWYWYRKALETGFQADMIRQKLAEVEQKSRFERRVISILGIIAVCIVVGVLLIR